jgi:hypothetical protein
MIEIEYARPWSVLFKRESKLLFVPVRTLILEFYLDVSRCR